MAINPPPIQVPQQFARDPQLNDFFKQLLKVVFQLWTGQGGTGGTGGGTPGNGGAGGGGGGGGMGGDATNLGPLFGMAGAGTLRMDDMQEQIDVLTAAGDDDKALAPLHRVPALAGQMDAASEQACSAMALAGLRQSLGHLQADLDSLGMLAALPGAPAAMLAAIGDQLAHHIAATFAALAAKETRGTAASAVAEHEAGTTVHPLSALKQSGATLNQVPQWNGTAWVAATVSGGGGGADSRTSLAYSLIMGGI